MDANAVASEQTSAPAPEAKVSLLEMILAAESEVERIETWRNVLRSEGSQVDPGLARRQVVYRRMVATLELLKLHEKAFVAMVKETRGRQRRQAASVPATVAPTTATEAEPPAQEVIPVEES